MALRALDEARQLELEPRPATLAAHAVHALRRDLPELLFLNLDAFALLSGPMRTAGTRGVGDGFRFTPGRNDPQTRPGVTLLDTRKSRSSLFHDFILRRSLRALLFVIPPPVGR